MYITVNRNGRTNQEANVFNLLISENFAYRLFAIGKRFALLGLPLLWRQ